MNNLIINALTHNPPETKVTISIDTNSEKEACVYISDNGTGMSEAEQAELFNRYYRGTNTKEKWSWTCDCKADYKSSQR